MFVPQCRYLENYRDQSFVVKIKVKNMKINGQNGILTRQSSYGSGDGVRVKDKRFGRAVVSFDGQPSYGSGDGVRVEGKWPRITVVGPKKDALLSGPPGIGKTTTAVLVGKESGRHVMEMNASDTRSKKSLEEGLGDVTGTQVLSFHLMGKSGKTRGNHHA